MFSFSGIWYLDLLSLVFLLLSAGLVPYFLFLYAQHGGDKTDTISRPMAKYCAWMCLVGFFATAVWTNQDWLINQLGERGFWLPLGLMILGLMSGAWGYGDKFPDVPRMPRS